MTENTVQVRVRVSRELLYKMDRHRGLIPRERWMRAVLERVVGDDVPETTPSDTKGGSPQGSSLASVPTPSSSPRAEGVRPEASPPLYRAEGSALDAALSGQGPGDTHAVPNPRGSRSVTETASTEHSALPRTHPDSDSLPLSRQQRLNAEKAKRKPKKGKS